MLNGFGVERGIDIAASWQEVPVDHGDWSLLRQSVLQLAIAIRQLAGSDAVRNPSAGVKARAWLDSAVNWPTSEGSTQVAHVLGGIGTVCLSTADHMEEIANSVLRGRGTVAVWTLARAAIESAGRANYMLNASSDVDLLSRHVASIRAELRYARHGVLIVRDSGRLDVDRYLRDLREMVEVIGGEYLTMPGYTALATSVLEEAAPESDSRLRYSQLSGVAHGELPALQMFLSPGAGLVLPRVLLLGAVHMVCGAAIVVGDKLRDTVTDPRSLIAAQWNASRDRALVAAKDMR